MFAFGVPAIILAHEFGHYSYARICGHQARIRTARTDWTGEFKNKAEQRHFSVRCALAGPVVELSLATLGSSWLYVYVRRRRRAQPIALAVWPASLCCTAGFRWFKIALQGSTTDEAELSSWLGFHWQTLPLLLLPLSLAYLAVLLYSHFRLNTWVDLSFGVIGGIAGGLVWLYIAGPALLGG